jgi:hypothetical protein
MWEPHICCLRLKKSINDTACSRSEQVFWWLLSLSYPRHRNMEKKNMAEIQTGELLLDLVLLYWKFKEN